MIWGLLLCSFYLGIIEFPLWNGHNKFTHRIGMSSLVWEFNSWGPWASSSACEIFPTLPSPSTWSSFMSLLWTSFHFILQESRLEGSGSHKPPKGKPPFPASTALHSLPDSGLALPAHLDSEGHFSSQAGLFHICGQATAWVFMRLLHLNQSWHWSYTYHSSILFPQLGSRLQYAKGCCGFSVPASLLADFTCTGFALKFQHT